MRIIVVTGISGSGKSIALTALEDAGYYCVDNLPPSLLNNLIQTLIENNIQHTAIAIDVRSANSFESLSKATNTLRTEGHDVHIIYLTAKTEALIARFSETRRRHPLSHIATLNNDKNQTRTLEECITEERHRLTNIEASAHVIDTSGMNANKLRSWITQFIELKHATLTLLFESFAYKFGVPLDADFVFDARTLPNPFYDPNLRLLTGLNTPVIEFLTAEPDAQSFLSDITQLITRWLPAFKNNHRSYLTIAIGCTGGQHRSVYLTEQLAKHFIQTECVMVRHRELGITH